MNSQQEPGGKSGSKHECENDVLILILPVWEFDVHVTSSVAKNIVRVSGDIGKMSYLKDDADWESALACIDSKVPLARKNAVSIEIRNLVRIISTYRRLAHVK